jgi:hypothetical protein
MEKDLNTGIGTLISEWYGQGNGRSARLYSGWQGHTVEFVKNNEVVERRGLWEHTRQYAEDACENWVEEIIK